MEMLMVAITTFNESGCQRQHVMKEVERKDSFKKILMCSCFIVLLFYFAFQA